MQVKQVIPSNTEVTVAPGITVWHDGPDAITMTTRYEEETVSQQGVATEPEGEGQDDN